METPGTGRISQKIIIVEAKGLDRITDREGRQCGLPLVGRGPGVQGNTASDVVKRWAGRRGSAVDARVEVVTGFGGEGGPVQEVSPVRG